MPEQKNDSLKITVINWREYQPRTDLKSMTWFRLSSSIAEHPGLFKLDSDGKWLFIFLLSQCAKKNIITLDTDISYLEYYSKVPGEKILQILQTLHESELIRYETVQTRTDSCPTLHNKHNIDNTGHNNTSKSVTKPDESVRICTDEKPANAGAGEPALSVPDALKDEEPGENKKGTASKKEKKDRAEVPKIPKNLSAGQILVAYFSEKYLDKYEEAYKPTWAVDVKRFNELLKLPKTDVDKIKIKIDTFFNMKMDWIEGKRDLGLFISQYNKIGLGKTGKPSDNPKAAMDTVNKMFGDKAGAR